MKRIFHILLLATVSILFLSACNDETVTRLNDTKTLDNNHSYNIRKFLVFKDFKIDISGEIEENSVKQPISGYVIRKYAERLYGTPDVMAEDFYNGSEGKYIAGEVNLGDRSVGFYDHSMSDGIIINDFSYFNDCKIINLDEITPIPENAKVGYVSDMLRLSCSEGEYREYFYTLKESSEAYATLNVALSHYEQEGASASISATVSYTIDKDLMLIAYKETFLDHTNDYRRDIASVSMETIDPTGHASYYKHLLADNGFEIKFFIKQGSLRHYSYYLTSTIGVSDDVQFNVEEIDTLRCERKDEQTFNCSSNLKTAVFELSPDPSVYIIQGVKDENNITTYTDVLDIIDVDGIQHGQFY